MAVIILRDMDHSPGMSYVHTVIVQGCTWVWSDLLEDPDFKLRDAHGEVPEIPEGASLGFLKVLCGGVFDDALVQANLKEG